MPLLPAQPPKSLPDSFVAPRPATAHQSTALPSASQSPEPMSKPSLRSSLQTSGVATPPPASPVDPSAAALHTSTEIEPEDDTFDEAAFIKAQAVERMREAAALSIGRDAIAALGASITHSLHTRSRSFSRITPLGLHAGAAPSAVAITEAFSKLDSADGLDPNQRLSALLASRSAQAHLAAASSGVDGTAASVAAAAAAVAATSGQRPSAFAGPRRARVPGWLAAGDPDGPPRSFSSSSSRLGSATAGLEGLAPASGSPVIAASSGTGPASFPETPSLSATTEAESPESESSYGTPGAFVSTGPDSARARQRLGSLLALRSDPHSLRNAGILLTPDDAADTIRRHAASRNALDSLLAARPTSEALIARQVLPAPGVDELASVSPAAIAAIAAGDIPPPSAVAAAAAATARFQPTFRRVEIAADKDSTAAAAAADQSPVAAASVACGWGHTLVRTLSGQVYAFGTPANGRLGLPQDAVAAAIAESAESAGAAARALATTGEASFAAGAAAAAVAAAGDVTVPTRIPAFEGAFVESVVSGDGHCAAIARPAGGNEGDKPALYTWGMGAWGRLGHGLYTAHDSATPERVTLLVPPATPVDGAAPGSDWVETYPVFVACGSAHTLVLAASGHVLAFGWNKNGRLGVTQADITAAAHAHARRLIAARNAAAAAAAATTGAEAESTSEAKDETTEVAAMVNALHQTSSMAVPFPVVISSLPSFLSLVGVDAGETASAAWDSRGRVWVWGAGITPLTVAPGAAAIAAVSAAAAANASAGVSAALLSASPSGSFSLSSASSGSFGGHARKSSVSGFRHARTGSMSGILPPLVDLESSPEGLRAARAAGGASAGFARAAGWRADILVPTPAAALARWSILSVSLGTYHGAARTTAGTLVTWGVNKDGQLGRPEAAAGSRKGVVASGSSAAAANNSISSSASGSGSSTGSSSAAAAFAAIRRASASGRILTPQALTATSSQPGAAAGGSGPQFHPAAEVSLPPVASSAASSAAGDDDDAEDNENQERVVMVQAAKAATVAITSRGRLLVAGRAGKGALGYSNSPVDGSGAAAEATEALSALTPVPLCAEALAEGRAWAGAAASWGHIVAVDTGRNVYTAGTASQGKLGYPLV